MTQEAKKKSRRMRLPNGIGSVHKIGDGKNRRNPWRARVPSHLEYDNDAGKATQKYITIGYFPTEKEAIAALFEYHKNPYTIEASKATFADVFEMWKAKKYPELSKSAQSVYNVCYDKHSLPLHDMKMRDIRTSHMECIMASVSVKYDAQSKIKQLWSQMFRFAMERDIVQKNYAEFVSLRDKPEETKRTAIPSEDIAKIWAAIDAGDPVAEIAMLYIYTGMRASELLQAKKESVDIDARILIGGNKTAAGKNRRIPLHTAILPIVQRWMVLPGEYLITDKRHKPISYQNFLASHWEPFMERMGMKYTPHYARHTCATMMREANIPDDLRKAILGHANGDITARYTHLSDAMLIEAIDRLPGRI